MNNEQEIYGVRRHRGNTGTGTERLWLRCRAATLENGDKKDVTIAVFNGWDEGIAASELWKVILDEKGYDVKLQSADVAPVFSGLSTGDYDLTLDTWLPVTHKS